MYTLESELHYKHPVPLFPTWTPPTAADEEAHHYTIIALRISVVLFDTDIDYAADFLKSDSSRRFLVMEYSFYSFIIPAWSAYFPYFAASSGFFFFGLPSKCLYDI